MSDASPVAAYHKSCELYLRLQAVQDSAERNRRMRRLNTIWRACFRSLMEVAAPQDPDVCHALGDAFDNGRGIERNREEAIRWFHSAAQAGHTRAMVRLGHCLRDSGVPAKAAEAIRWFREAAERGYPGGMVCLGFAYREGRGVPCDLREAVRWFIKAVEAGDKQAMIHVGRMYSWYLSSPPDAVHWFLRAAEAGLSESFVHLALIYDDRNSGLYDPVEATKWYHVAAERPGGDAPRAMLALARRYRDGVGSPQDSKTAKEWLRRLLESAPKQCAARKEGIAMLSHMQEELL